MRLKFEIRLNEKEIKCLNLMIKINYKLKMEQKVYGILQIRRVYIQNKPLEKCMKITILHNFHS